MTVPLEIEWLLGCMLLPAIVAAAIAFFVLRLIPSDWAQHMYAGWAVAGGFIAAYLFVPWTPIVPKQTWHWLPALALFAAAIDTFRQSRRTTLVVGISLSAMLFALAAWLLVPNWPHLRPTRLTYVLCVFGLLGAASLLLESARRRVPAFTQLVTLTLAAAGGIVVLILSGNMKFAQLTAALAFSTTGCLAMVYFIQDSPRFSTVTLAYVVLIGGLLLSGFLQSYSGVPIASYLLIFAAPSSVWLGEIPAIRSGPPRRRLLVPAGAAFAMITASIALALG